MASVPHSNTRLVPYCVELTASEWSTLARSPYITHAIANRWLSIYKQEASCLCVLAQDSLEEFLAAGGRLWRFTPQEIEFIQALRAILQTVQHEGTHAHRAP